MTIHLNEMLMACEVVLKNERVEVCVTESFKGALITSAGSFILGILMGPLGLAVGGAVGGVAASRYCRRYEPLINIITSMSDEEKQRLGIHMKKILDELSITDVAVLMTIVQNPESAFRKQILNSVVSYFGVSLPVA